MGIFRGRRVQRGHGFGSIFASLFRRALPILKRGGKYLGKKALRAGSGVLEDIERGYKVKGAVKRRPRMTASKIADDVKRYTGMRGDRYVKLSRIAPSSRKEIKRERCLVPTASKKKKKKKYHSTSKADTVVRRGSSKRKNSNRSSAEQGRKRRRMMHEVNFLDI